MVMAMAASDREIALLAQVYETARKRVLQSIQTGRISNPFWQNQLVRLIDRELSSIRAKNTEWADKYVAKAYADGVAEAQEETGITGAINFVQINRSAIAELVHSMTQNLDAEMRKSGRRTNDVIADAGIRASAEALAQAEPSYTKTRLIDELNQNDIFTVTYRNGAKVPASAYAAMVARTTTHEAAHTAKLDFAAANGYDLVKMPSHYPTCEICAKYQGRVYSISGKDKRFPPLEKAFYRQYNIIHPNCRHPLSIWVEDMQTPEEIEAAIQNSNRPFVDDRTDAEKARYAAQQMRKRRQNRRLNLVNSQKRGIINTGRDDMGIAVEIDQFTPCLVEKSTGKIVQTLFQKANKNELKGLTRAGWNFNWSDNDLSDCNIFKLVIPGDDRIQGLIAIKDYKRDRAIYVKLAESAPHNRGKNKQYQGAGGHLFAIAAYESMKQGYGGFMFMDAKNTALVEHYQKTLNAKFLGRPHPYRMFVDEESAQALLKIYTLEEG